MTLAAARRAGLVVAIVLAVAFALLAHAAIIEGVPASVGAALSLVPLSLFALMAARRARHRVAAVAAIALAAVALVLGWPQLERNFPHVFFLEHAGAHLVLAIVFGRTLGPGHDPLVMRFARLVHGHLPPEVERYTRKVTVAWTVFFATLFTLSSVLYLGNFREAWSLLANILSPVLVGGMFVAEYAVRLRALPHWERVGILRGVRAFTRHFGQAPVETPR